MTGPGQGQSPSRIVVVSGIFPPDIGGPATHAELAASELQARGHHVHVITFTDERAVQRNGGITRWPRRWPATVRAVLVASWLARHRSSYDAVYALGAHPAAVLGSRIARRPVVVKIAGDPAWERATRLRRTDSTFDAYQRQAPQSLRERGWHALRDWTVRRATAVAVPSSFLADTVRGWQHGLGAVPQVIPNGVAVPSGLNASRRPYQPPLRTVAVARLVGHKYVDVLLEAVHRTKGVELTVIGDGPDRARLERIGAGRRVKFIGSLPRDKVLERLAGADLLLSASAYEGLPHATLEALALGTPVLCSSAGGNTEVVHDGINGRVVHPPTPASYAHVLAELRDDAAQLDRLRAGALSTSMQWTLEQSVDAAESLLRSATRAIPDPRPRMVNIGKSRLASPPDPRTARKFDVVNRHLRAAFVVTGRPAVRRDAGVLVIALPALRPRLAGGLLFYGVAPLVAMALAAVQPGTTIVCQSPFEAVGVLALRPLLPKTRYPRVVVEVHGDWKTAARMYGGRSRHLFAPAADALARWSLARADRIRAVGPAMRELVLREVGSGADVIQFVTYSDFRSFLDQPVRPFRPGPRALFAGSLEQYKGPDVLVDAWNEVIHAVPDARLTIAGDGPMRARLRARIRDLGIADSVEFLGQVSPSAIEGLLDDATCLVLPSRSEGLPRVAIEAMSRGRAIIGTAVGGIPDVVEHRHNGLLVPSGNASALATALTQLLANPQLAQEMGREGRRRAEEIDPAGQYEAGIVGLAGWMKTTAPGQSRRRITTPTEAP